MDTNPERRARTKSTADHSGLGSVNEMTHEHDGGHELNHGEESAREFFVASGDATEIVEAAEEVLDAAALAIVTSQPTRLHTAMGERGNGGLDAVCGEQVANRVCIVGLIGDDALDRAGRPGLAVHLGERHAVVALAF